MVSDSASELPIEIDVRAVSTMIDEHEPIVLLDCREQGEYETVHLAESSLIPMSELEHRVGELSPHTDAHVVVYCHHGGRSLQVAAWLRQQGFARAQSMSGGIDRWAVEIDPSLPRY